MWVYNLYYTRDVYRPQTGRMKFMRAVPVFFFFISSFEMRPSVRSPKISTTTRGRQFIII